MEHLSYSSCSMARQTATKNKQHFMADEKKLEPKGRTMRHDTSCNSLSDPETRAKATMKDIEELYTALQGLVPKVTSSRERREPRSGTTSDTPKDDGDSSPSIRRRYNSEKLHKNRHKHLNKNTIDIRLDSDAKQVTPRVTSDNGWETSTNGRVLTDERPTMPVTSHSDRGTSTNGRVLTNERPTILAMSDNGRNTSDNGRNTSDNDQGTSSNGREKSTNGGALTGERPAIQVASDNCRKASTNGRVLTDERRVMSEDCLFVGDSELSTTEGKAGKARRVRSLPAYPDESENEEEAPRKPKFSLFRRGRRRRRPKTKTKTKKKLSWRSLLSTLSFRSSSTKKSKKKRSKNKATSDLKRNQTEQLHSIVEETVRKSTPTVRRAATEMVRQSPLIQKQPTPTVRRATTERVGKTPLTDGVLTVRRASAPRTPGSQKRQAPDPPVDVPALGMNRRKNTMETKTDEVQKKLSTWYKYAVKETNSPAPRTKHHKSYENLLTDTEVLRARNSYSSDTDSVENLERLKKVRVRRTRAHRNRRQERARWRSLPNVKLVSLVLKKTTEEKQTNESIKSAESYDAGKEPADVTVSVKHATSVSPLVTQISFGNNSGEDEATEEPITDFMNIQNGSNSRWVSRQCSKTSVSYIRPLKLSLFYSESPSRETVNRSHTFCASDRLWFTGNPDVKSDTTNDLGGKARHNSSRRGKQRRSFKRQPRLPQHSPFYFPTAPPSSSKFFGSSKESLDDAKDSGLGSPDLSEEKVFGMTSAGKRKHSEERTKTNGQLEVSECGPSTASNQVNKVEHGVQTDPVRSRVTTKVTIAPHSRTQRVINVLGE